MPPGRILAEFTDYDGLLAAVRARIEELAVNGERFDEFAGLPRGYLSKLIGIRPQRRISMVSMGPLFGALGIRCVLIEDQTATTRLKTRLKPNNGSYRRAAPRVLLTDRQFHRIQKLGRQSRWRRLNKKQRSEIMRAVRLGVKFR